MGIFDSIGYALLGTTEKEYKKIKKEYEYLPDKDLIRMWKNDRYTMSNVKKTILMKILHEKGYTAEDIN